MIDTIKLNDKINEIKKELVNVFKITNWDICICFNENMTVQGETFIVYNDNKATINLNVNQKEEEIILTFIHEIVHIVKRNSQEIAQDNIKNDDVRTIWTREMEREQQCLANGIYELLLKR